MVEHTVKAIDQLVTAGISPRVEDYRGFRPFLSPGKASHDRMPQLPANTHLVENFKEASTVKMTHGPSQIARAAPAYWQHGVEGNSQWFAMPNQTLETTEDIRRRRAQSAVFQLNVHDIKRRKLADNLRNQLIAKSTDRSHGGAQEVLVKIKNGNVIILL